VAEKPLPERVPRVRISPPPQIITQYNPMITVKYLLLEILGFIFYLYELARFLDAKMYFEAGNTLAATGMGMEEYGAKFAVLLVALPFLYLYRIANFFHPEDIVFGVLSHKYKFHHSHVEEQLKLFYYATFGLLAVLAFVRIIRSALSLL
jgi:hypothetical protein